MRSSTPNEPCSRNSASVDVLVGDDSPASVRQAQRARTDDLDAAAALSESRFGLGWLPTSATAEEVVAAIEAASLTPREVEVLHALAAGLGNKTIARELQISEHTAKFHVG